MLSSSCNRGAPCHCRTWPHEPVIYDWQLEMLACCGLFDSLGTCGAASVSLAVGDGSLTESQLLRMLRGLCCTFSGMASVNTSGFRSWRLHLFPPDLGLGQSRSATSLGPLFFYFSSVSPRLPGIKLPPDAMYGAAWACISRDSCKRAAPLCLRRLWLS